jgi:hypothetical protein
MKTGWRMFSRWLLSLFYWTALRLATDGSLVYFILKSLEIEDSFSLTVARLNRFP